MKEKTGVRQGTLALMVLRTVDVLGPLHGYGIARRIEQISGDLPAEVRSQIQTNLHQEKQKARKNLRNRKII